MSPYQGVSKDLRTRLWVLHNAIKAARDARDVAALMLIIQDGLVTDHFLAVEFSYKNPMIEVNLKLKEPPWMMKISAHMPFVRVART